MEENFYDKIYALKKELDNKRLPFFGRMEISYSDLGKVLTIQFSGDVPTGFNPGYFVFLHPSSDKKGWLKPGEIGIILNGQGKSINSLEFPKATADVLQNVALRYFGDSVFINGKSDLTPFAEMGYYQNRILNENLELKKKLKNFIKTTIREFLNEQHENTEYHDLFEFYDEQPIELKKIVDFYSNKLENGDYKEDTYKLITKFHDAVYKIGYTFDSGLDGQPYGLRPIGVELNQLKGWENIDN